MFSARQCEAARLMTGTDTPDEQIVEEYAAMLGPNRSVAAMRLNGAVKQYGLPFEQAWEHAQKDFREIAAQYGVSPATLLCLYIEWESANNEK